jgi:hypothetical protein
VTYIYIYIYIYIHLRGQHVALNYTGVYLVKVLPVTRGRKVVCNEKRVTLPNGIIFMLLCEENSQTSGKSF